MLPRARGEAFALTLAAETSSAMVEAEGDQHLSVEFDPESSSSRSVLIRMFYPDKAGIVLWIMFGMVVHVIAAWIVAIAIWQAFDLDIDHRDGIASILLVVLLTVSWWQHGSRSAKQQANYGRLNLTLEPQGIFLSSSVFDVRCRWAVVRRIEIRKDHLVLTYLDQRGVAIPRDAFGSEASLQRFAEAARKLKSEAASRD